MRGWSDRRIIEIEVSDSLSNRSNTRVKREECVATKGPCECDIRRLGTHTMSLWSGAERSGAKGGRKNAFMLTARVLFFPTTQK